MASSLDQAEQRWAKSCLRPTDQGVSRWEAQASDAGEERRWASQLGRSLRDIGAVPGEAYTTKYVAGVIEGARARKYSDGVSQAARKGNWRAGFLAGVNR